MSLSWSTGTGGPIRPKGKETHVIADNLSAHKTKNVEDFLVSHCNILMHFTPMYSS
jgi:hypothetical protein